MTYPPQQPVWGQPPAAQPWGTPATPQVFVPQQGQVVLPPQNGGMQYDPAQVPPAPQPPQPAPVFGPQQPQPYGLQTQAPQAPQQPGYPQASAQGYGQPQAPAQLPPQGYDNMVLQGPQWPAHLQGRTVAQARQMQQRPPAYAPPQAPQSFVPSAPQAPFQQAPQAPTPPFQQTPPAPPTPSAQPPVTPRSFFQAPEETIRSIVQETVAPVLAPVVQQAQAQQALQARHMALQQIPDFQQLEPHIVQVFQESGKAENLLNPAAWVAAADLARGRMMRGGAHRPQQFQGQPQGTPTYSPPPAYGFFSEGPSAPATPGGYGPAQMRQPTPEEQDAARKHGMQIGDFMAWKYGAAVQGMPAVPAAGGW